jgi:hypothetical protein
VWVELILLTLLCDCTYFGKTNLHNEDSRFIILGSCTCSSDVISRRTNIQALQNACGNTERSKNLCGGLEGDEKLKIDPALMGSYASTGQSRGTVSDSQIALKTKHLSSTIIYICAQIDG